MSPFIKSPSCFFDDMMIIAPTAAPPIVRISAGWMSAPTSPPEMTKPDITHPMTTRQPTMTIMTVNLVQGTDLRIARQTHGSPAPSPRRNGNHKNLRHA